MKCGGMMAIGIVLGLQTSMAGGNMGNLHFLDRFDNRLAGWTLNQAGGTVKIADVSASDKLELDDRSETKSVSAKTPFAAPSAKYIVEYDMCFAANNAGIFELLDASNNPIVNVSGGMKNNTLSFSTDTEPATTVTWTDATYNQVTLAIDPAAKTVRCYWIDKSYSASAYNPKKQVAVKNYSGAAAAQLSFRTDSTKTGKTYIDEVKVYAPDFAIVGDSASDGKPRWSNDPSTVYRLGAAGKPDQTSPPHYQLGLLLGKKNWVANLGFGGSQSSEIASLAQTLLLDQGFRRIWIKIGLNDFNRGLSAATVEKNIQSAVKTLIAGGITPSNIFLCNCYGASMLTAAKDNERKAYNTWLAAYCPSVGINLVDNDGTITDYTVSPVKPKPAYDIGDGVHLTKAGSGQMAQNVYKLLKTARQDK
ncbi:MAG: SGNH/GDSL hydrolase family protein [Victivallales bacterium]